MFQRHKVLLTALTPVSHGDVLTGTDNATNTRLFLRAGKLIKGRAVRVPALSENALRSNIFRRTLHDYLLETLGIEKGTLPQSVVNLMYSGGNLKGGSTVPGDEITLGHKVTSLYPSLKLLGGATDSFILPTSKLKLACWPLTSEYAPELRQVAPEYADEAESVSIFDLLTDELRTRGTGDDSSGNQMLYQYETLAAGSKFLLELTFDAHTSPEVIGAASLALAEWPGYFGGQGRQGRGRMSLTHDLPDAAPYLGHITANDDAMRSGLESGELGSAKVLCAA